MHKHTRLGLGLLGFVTACSSPSEDGATSTDSAIRTRGVQVAFQTAPLTVAPDTCSPPLTLGLESAAHSLVRAYFPVEVSLSSSAGIDLYADADCAAAVVHSATIASGQTSALLYFKGSAAGSYEVTADALFAGSARQTETVGSGTIGSGGADAGSPPGHGQDAGAPSEDGGSAPKEAGSSPDAGSPVDASSGISTPTQASAAGFNQLVFDDEFTSADTISPDGSGNFKWYSQGFFGVSLPASDYSVANGILTIDSDTSGYGAGLETASPSELSQAWQHAYFEASIRFNPGGHQGGAWPAFWSWSIEDGTQEDNVGGTRGPYPELDFFEAFPTGSSVTYITTIHQWLNSTDVSQNSNNVPKVPANTDWTQFHAFGCLWTPNQVVWYFDGSPVTTVVTGPGTPYTAIEQDHMFVLLGTGTSWPMDVDYVRIWQ